MSHIKPKRRWLQFSLRSVLLLTLAVALWLGYEVQQSRRIERAIAGLRAIGGSAECEPTAWSLLRLCRVPGYGQRVVRAEIPGASMEQAIELLRGSSGLREVQVNYDGTYDLTPSWQLATKALAGAIIFPKAIEDDIFDPEWLDDAKWKLSVPMRRLARMRARVVDVHPRLSTLRLLLLDSAHVPLGRKARYALVLLPEGILAEILIDEDTALAVPGTQHAFAVLLIEDKCAGVRGSRRARAGHAKKSSWKT